MKGKGKGIPINSYWEFVQYYNRLPIARQYRMQGEAGFSIAYDEYEQLKKRKALSLGLPSYAPVEAILYRYFRSTAPHIGKPTIKLEFKTNEELMAFFQSYGVPPEIVKNIERDATPLLNELEDIESENEPAKKLQALEEVSDKPSIPKKFNSYQEVDYPIDYNRIYPADEANEIVGKKFSLSPGKQADADAANIERVLLQGKYKVNRGSVPRVIKTVLDRLVKSGAWKYLPAERGGTAWYYRPELEDEILGKEAQSKLNFAKAYHTIIAPPEESFDDLVDKIKQAPPQRYIEIEMPDAEAKDSALPEPVDKPEKQPGSKRLQILENSLIKKEQRFRDTFDRTYGELKGRAGQPLYRDNPKDVALVNRLRKADNTLRNIKQSQEATQKAIEREKGKILSANWGLSQLPDFIIKFIEAGVITQWRKNPFYFFVPGVEKGRIHWDGTNRKLLNSYYDSIPNQAQKDKFKAVWQEMKDAYNTYVDSEDLSIDDLKKQQKADLKTALTIERQADKIISEIEAIRKDYQGQLNNAAPDEEKALREKVRLIESFKSQAYDVMSRIYSKRREIEKTKNYRYTFNPEDYQPFDYSQLINALRPEPKQSFSNSDLVQLVPLSQINVAKHLFQNRQADFSQESVTRILEAVDRGKFRWQVFDPILLWLSPDNGKLYILSGHSRTEAFRQLSAAGVTVDGQSFDSIPAKIISVPESEARQIALNSNTLATRESDLERAAYYRRAIDNGEDLKDVRREARQNEGKNATYIINLAFLNPTGEIIQNLEMFAAGEDTGNLVKLKAIADWVGEARSKYSALTNSHENEIYHWLADEAYGNAKGKIRTKTEFLQRLGTTIERRINFGNLDERLNLSNSVYKSDIEAGFDAELDSARRELASAEKLLEDKRREFVSRGAEGDRLKNALQQYDLDVQGAIKRLKYLESQKGNVRQAASAQASLFGVRPGRLTT